MATLTLDAVSKIYGPRLSHPIRAVDTVSLALRDGELVGLLGSSGCGKTSTLRMIAGFESVSEGTIRIGDRVINDLRPAERNVAMAFEGYALYPPLTVRDNIGFSLLRDRIPKAEVQQRVAHVAALLEIGDILDRYPQAISGGQQQRVSLARALVRRAQLSLLDEPMSQLEPQLRAVLRARIKDYLIEHRMTTVFVTHDQTEALALADRIAVMEGGRLQQFASPTDLKRRPANLFVAGFIGEPPMNLFPARVVRENGGLAVEVQGEAGGFRLPHAGPGLAEGGKVHLGIRGHEIRVGTARAGETQLQGTVIANQWLGDQSHIALDVNGVRLTIVTDRALEAAADTRLALALPESALHLFDSDSEMAIAHGGRPAVAAAA
ncbi:ABC transporter ATP-binding protein [Mycobacterium sp. KBS0706]|uniref:ABC transporter ATP-binding protein n=1 Tax=Mycobacterium sp. KBS0706 TaxID=2578109 RepID=UPI00110FEFEB|nr:ABC transporter ATP-binding protein [Mycobacterium sp. KBS0706]TSD87604.1 ABC transporter ATP-binding protein [Mycobacterium sp. KBS0706]